VSTESEVERMTLDMRCKLGGQSAVRWMVSLVGLAASACFASAAQAQQQSPDPQRPVVTAPDAPEAEPPDARDARSGSGEPIDTITVLGTRQSGVPLSSVPISITSVPAERIREELGTATRIEDVLGRTVPGFNPSNVGVRQIRGRTAQVFLNGVPVNEQLRASGGRDINLISPDQLGGIEVSRGANSAYGFGSPGGIIALSTPRARSEELSLLSRAQFSFNPYHPASSGQLRLYQSASQIIGAFDYHLGAALGYDGLEYDSDGELALAFNSPNGISSNAKELPLSADLSLGYEFGGGNLRFAGTWNRVDVREGYENEGLGVYREQQSELARFAPGDENFRDAHTLNLSYENPDVLGSAVKLELLQSKSYAEVFQNFDGALVRDEQTNRYWGVRSSATLPLDLLREGLAVTTSLDWMRNRYYRPIFSAASGQVVQFTSPDTTLDSFAPALQLELPLGPLRLSGGVRHERYSGRVKTASGAPPGQGNLRGGDMRDFDLTLFNAAILLPLRDGFEVYASYSQGAEISQIGRSASGADAAAQIDPRPAKSNQYELGLRGRRGGAEYGVSAFFTTSDLLSALQPDPRDPDNLPMIPLREPREFYGVEANLHWVWNERWALGGTVTWYEGKRKPEGSGEWRHIGSSEIPPFLASTYLQYTPLPGWRNRLVLDYRGSRDRFGRGLAFDEGRIDALALLHFSLALELGRGELSLGVQNLLNEHYFSIPAQSYSGGFLWVPEQGTRLSLSYSQPW
jgi:iron complex outermembrane receptor protein